VLNPNNDSSLLIMAAAMPGLLLIECDFSLVHGALIQITLFWVLLFHACIRLGLLKQKLSPATVEGDQAR
jgi:hypothetical protein